MKKFSIVMLILVMVAGMFMMPAASLAEGTDEFKVEYYGKAEKEDFTVDGEFSKSLKGGNFCVIKQASGHVIVWSEDELSAEELEKVREVVLKEDSSIKDEDEFHPVYGIGEFDGGEIAQDNWGTYTITKVDGSHVLTCDAQKISHLDYGKYTRPVEETGQGEWVPVSTSSDSCTGYGKVNTLVGNSWFLKQTLNADTEYPINLDIIAGNPKNGTNVVGTLTVDKVDGVYQLSYKFNEQAQPPEPQIGDTYTAVEIHDAHYNYSGSGVTINKAPGKNLVLTNGETFTPTVNENNEYDLFSHFSITVTTYEYQLVPVVAE